MVLINLSTRFAQSKQIFNDLNVKYVIHYRCPEAELNETHWFSYSVVIAIPLPKLRQIPSLIARFFMPTFDLIVIFYIPSRVE